MSDWEGSCCKEIFHCQNNLYALKFYKSDEDILIGIEINHGGNYFYLPAEEVPALIEALTNFLKDE